MKIAVINIYNFPVGMAPTTRIIGYCKGLLQAGAKVDIISVVPKKETDKTFNFIRSFTISLQVAFRYAMKLTQISCF